MPRRQYDTVEEVWKAIEKGRELLEDPFLDYRTKRKYQTRVEELWDQWFRMKGMGSFVEVRKFIWKE